MYPKLENIDIIRWQGVLENEIYNKKQILSKSNIPNKKTNLNLFSFSTIKEQLVLFEDKKLDQFMI